MRGSERIPGFLRGCVGSGSNLPRTVAMLMAVLSLSSMAACGRQPNTREGSSPPLDDKLWATQILWKGEVEAQCKGQELALPTTTLQSHPSAAGGVLVFTHRTNHSSLRVAHILASRQYTPAVDGPIKNIEFSYVPVPTATEPHRLRIQFFVLQGGG